jgi:Carboxypeptidase regulatory-like domain
VSISRLAAKTSAMLLLLCGAAYLAYAQSSNANLSGTVTDSSGAVVAGAQLTLSNTARKSTSTYQSDDGGRYVFRDLEPGTYSLQVAKTGFQTTMQTGIVLTINASAHNDVILKVGPGVETVEVLASTSLVNYDNATVQGGIEPQTLSALPIAIADGNQRSSAQLAVLLPGVTTSSGGDAYNARINGGQQSGDEAILDGATLSEGYLSQSGMVAIHTDFPVSPDMISELKVVTSTYEPQYGFTTSGQIVAQTKSGGTSFHGSGYVYLRNDGLNAKQWGVPAGSPRTFDHEMDAGANIGGPIKLPWVNSGKNKAFFFFNWEPYRLNGGATRPILTIPTMKQRAGDFTDNLDSDGNLIPIYDPRTGQQFSCNGVLNVICPNLVDPIAQAWLAQLPTPTSPGTSNNYLAPHAVPNYRR